MKNRKKGSRCVALCLLPQCLLVLVGLVASVAAQPSGGLFVTEAPGQGWLVPREGVEAGTVLRQRLARIDQEILTATRLSVDDAVAQPTVVRLNLFDDSVFDAVVHRTGPTSAGYWLSGHIEGPLPGSLILVVNNDIAAGAVLVPGGTYSIRGALDGVLAIQQIDLSTLRGVPERAEPRMPASPGGPDSDRVQPITLPPPSSPAATAGDAEDGSRIDVLVVYDPESRNWFGGHAEIKAQIDLVVAGTNEAFGTSGVIQRIHLVSAQEERLSSEEVLGLRDQWAADIVVGVDSIQEACAGSLSLYESLQGEPLVYEGSAFAILTPECLDPYTFTHELGHVMGLWHDRYTVQHLGGGFTSDGRVSYKPYSYGYVNQRAFDAGAPTTSRWTTIMAYDEQCNRSGFSCNSVFRFSNPDQMWIGDPLGVPGDERSSEVTGPADARRSLNDARRIIANYRVSPCLTDGSQIWLQARTGQFLTAERGGGGAVLADRNEAGAWERFELVERNGGCVESGAAVSLRSSDGFYLRAELGGGSDLDATGTSAGAWETFTVHRQAGDGAIRSGDFIALEASDGHYVVAVLGGGGAVNAGGTRFIEAWETFRITASS